MSCMETKEKLNGEELVSVIMPNYNGGEFIKHAVNSVINQTYKNWELIFVDDCSTDNSLEIIEELRQQDKRIKVYKNSENKGAATSRNIALEQACGRFIAFLDADDMWYSDKLNQQLAFMSQNDVAFCCTAYEVIDAEGNKTSEYYPKKEIFGYKDILKHNSIGCLTVIFDLNKISDVTMPIEAARREDHACWLKILRTGVKAYCLNEILSSYRVHQSVSYNKRKMVKYQWNVYKNVEKLGFFKSVKYMLSWMWYGFFKYRK